MATILVVDDCPDTSDFFSLVLLSKGHVVFNAESVRDALEVAYTHKGTIDVLLTDLHLSDGLGSELTHLLGKKAPKTKILVTGRDPYPAKRYDGFDDYLIKPVDIDNMVKTVENCIILHTEEHAS